MWWAPQVQTLGLASSALKGCLTPACITQAGLQSLCGMTQLTALDLSGHAAISDASIALIAQHLFSLRQLDLRKPACDTPATDSVTDTGIATLRSLTALESLRVSQAQVSSSLTLVTQTLFRKTHGSYTADLHQMLLCACVSLSGPVLPVQAGGPGGVCCAGHSEQPALPGAVLLREPVRHARVRADAAERAD